MVTYFSGTHTFELIGPDSFRLIYIIMLILHDTLEYCMSNVKYSRIKKDIPYAHKTTIMALW